MEFFDSHAHYNDEKFNEDRDIILKQCKEAGITRIVNAGYSLKSSELAVEIANKYEFVYATCGISPNDITSNFEQEIKELEIIAKSQKTVAIGEIGLDYYWNKENKDFQKECFIKQINLANKLNLPIVIHSRDAFLDTIEILKANICNKKGIFHCCQANAEFAKKALELGYYISIAGPCTFKNAKNSLEMIKIVPDNKILIETDSPYLSPEPVRGTRNDSRNVKFVAQKIAQIKQKSIEEIAKMTYENANRIFEI